MEYRILGHLDVCSDDGPLPLGSTKQRALLAVLLIRRNQVVSVDTLVDWLWPKKVPARAANNIQVLVSRLRKPLGRETILRRVDGYLIRVEDEKLDAARFERLAREGRMALANSDPQRAAAVLEEALRLWRGPALAEFTYEEFARPEIARLEALRLDAAEDRIEADLALGRHRELVPELELFAAEHPFRERLRRQLILALYRCGRQADALAAFRAARTTFIEELGIELGAELRALERAVLAQDPRLEPPRRQAAARSRAVPHRALAAVCIVAVASAALAAALSGGGHRRPVLVRPDSIAVIDPHSVRVIDDLSTPITPGLLAGSGTSLWATAVRTNVVVRIDTRTRRIAQTFGVEGGSAVGLAADSSGVWTASTAGRRLVLLERFVPGRREPAATIELPNNPIFNSQRVTPIVLGAGALWVSNGETWVAKVDPDSGVVLDRVVPDEGVGPLAWGAGDLWGAYTLSDSVTRIDGRSATVEVSIPLAQPRGVRGDTRRGVYDPAALASGFGSIWVAAHEVDAVVRIDPVTNAVVATVRAGDGPHALTTGAGAVWVVNNRDGTVTKIDPTRNAAVATIHLGQTPSSVAVTQGRVWVAVKGQ